MTLASRVAKLEQATQERGHTVAFQFGDGPVRVGDKTMTPGEYEKWEKEHGEPDPLRVHFVWVGGIEAEDI